MRFLILIAAYTAVASAQLVLQPGKMGKLGEEIGGRVGSDIGGGFGRAFDGQLPLDSLTGGNAGPSRRPYDSRSGYGTGSEYDSDADRDYGTGGRYSGRDNERGSSSSGGRAYERQGSGGEFERKGSYSRERTVSERERGTGYEAGRGGQSSSRGASAGRADNYGRDRAAYDDGYSQVYNGN